MTEELEPLSEALEEARYRSLRDDLGDLAGQARDYARAELAFQKTRATYAGKEVRGIGLLIGAALVFLFFALMGLVFGLILALSPILTPWGATAVVCLGLMLAAGASAWTAWSRWRRMAALIGGDEA